MREWMRRQARVRGRRAWVGERERVGMKISLGRSRRCRGVVAMVRRSGGCNVLGKGGCR
jgi:hypothetical protein